MYFKKSYPGPLMYALFWRVCNAYSEFTFKIAMERIQNEAGIGVIKWFRDLGAYGCWARYKLDPNLCSDENKSNFVESFNALLGADGCKPILTLLEGIRRIIMVRHTKRQEIAESWDDNGICPKIKQYLKVVETDSRACQVFKTGKGEFEVKDGSSYLPVSFTQETCECGQWQISDIPCKHVVRACNPLKEPAVNYLSDWFSVKKYKEVYGLNIHPMPSQDRWLLFDLPTIQAPPLKRSIGCQ